MPPNKNKRSWYLLFSFAVIGGGITLLFLIISGAQKTFPPISMGVYVGKVSGIASSTESYRSLYLERLANTLLVVVFGEDGHPRWCRFAGMLTNLTG